MSGAAGPGGAGWPGWGTQQAPLPLGSPSACCTPRRHSRDLKSLYPQVAFPATSPALTGPHATISTLTFAPNLAGFYFAFAPFSSGEPLP